MKRLFHKILIEYGHVHLYSILYKNADTDVKNDNNSDKAIIIEYGQVHLYSILYKKANGFSREML